MAEELILAALKRIERERNVRVVFACESGSRAWGFASADSDYDVRFVYLSSVDHYLAISPQRDVIEEMLPSDLDVSGWDIRKALGLARKSNPPLIEWLRSPIFYQRDEELFPPFREAVEACYSPERCFMHYLHMALGNNREYLQGEEVWLKKYLYVLRPVMACRWIERWPDEPVPMEFLAVAERVVEEAALLDAIRDLLRKKIAGAELDRGPRISAISDFIDTELPRLKSMVSESVPTRPDTLDAYFHDVVLGSR